MTRVLAWVRALAAGRRRMAARTVRPVMVLARRRAVPAVTALHVDYHLTVLGGAGASVASVRRTVEPVGRRGALRVMPGGPGAPGPRGRTGPAGPRGAAYKPLVHERARRTPTRAVAMPVPALAAAVRSTAQELAAAHRRVVRQAPPRLRARPVEARAPEIDGPGGAPRLRAIRSRTAQAQDHAPNMVLRRSSAAVAQAAAEATVAAAAATPGRELVSARHAAATPALDVEALTDRVVAQIDRRIVAQRERFGQL